MKAPKKDATQKTPSFLQEPATEYVKPISEASETEEEMHPILVQLLEKALEESEQGLGIPHEEMMKIVKEKYPFINGI
jgi:hypothetical protein